MLYQVSVFVGNVPGSLLKVTKALSAADIEVQAVSNFDTPEFGILKLIVNKTDEAVELLKEEGYFVTTRPLLGVVLKNGGAHMNEMLEVLHNGNISITNIYSFMPAEDNSFVMVFQTEYMEETAQMLTNKGFTVR